MCQKSFERALCVCAHICAYTSACAHAHTHTYTPPVFTTTSHRFAFAKTKSLLCCKFLSSQQCIFFVFLLGNKEP